MKKLFPYFIAIVLMTGSLQVYSQQGELDSRIQGMQSISSHELFDYVKELSSGKYGGRLTGTPGYDSSAQWLIRHLEKWDIQPAGKDRTYLQWFDNPYTRVFPGCKVSLHIPRGDETILKHYDYVEEFIPGATSASGTVKAEVVYAGYGITAPELGYDDYKGIDVEDKIILIEREAPLNPRKNPEEFPQWEPYSRHQYKLKNAVRHGAAGMLYNYGPIVNPNNAYDPDFIYSHVGDSVVQDVFAGTGKTHEKVVAGIRNDLEPHSFNTGKVYSITNDTKHFPDGKGSNVIGWIEGSDPELKDEAIIIGAHLDHLGQCWELIPGANDNASGVAVMMGIARAMTEYDVKLKRSVIFLAFGAEEQGIVGSKEYLEDPFFPIDKTRALINLDGVGVGDKIGITAGKNYPELLEHVARVNDKYIYRKLNPSKFLNITRPRLDAARFMKAGVPILSFYAYGAPSVYHQPGDDVDLITPEIMQDMAQMVYMAVIDMANE
jgi:hypothetical protein